MVSEHVHARLPAPVREAILHHLGRQGPNTALSTKNAIEELRRQFPELGIADKDLAAEIAHAAVDNGLAVHFDGLPEQP